MLSAEIQNKFKLWWRRENKEPIIQITVPRGENIKLSWDTWSLIRHLSEPETAIDEFEEFCDNTHFVGESFPNLWLNLGPGIIAAYLGASVTIGEDTVWFETPKDWQELQNLKFDPENEWWKLTQRLALTIGERSKGRFIAGMPDLGGITDVLASLRGTENLLLDLIEHPEEVKRASALILDLWFRFYDDLHRIIQGSGGDCSAWMGLWSPGKWYPLQCDFSAMIGPDMFREFALPYLGAQCQRLDNSIYHLDGEGELPHLDMLLSISELDGIQWVPGAGNYPVDSPEWFPLYRRIQSSGKNLVLLEVSKENVEKLVKELSPKGLLIATTCSSQKEAEELMERMT